LLAAAYCNLLAAFNVATGSKEEHQFMLLLICDEVRSLCNVSARDGSRIPCGSHFNDRYDPVGDVDPGTIKRFYSNFRAFRRALRYLQLGKVMSKMNVGDDARVAFFPRVFALLTDTSSRLTNFQPAPWLCWNKVSALVNVYIREGVCPPLEYKNLRPNHTRRSNRL
jgi:hypothetical protein